MTTSIYLDNNATTRPLEAVNEIMQSTMSQQWGNPSSIHRIGQEARQLVDLAREQVAKLIKMELLDHILTIFEAEPLNRTKSSSWSII